MKATLPCFPTFFITRKHPSSYHINSLHNIPPNPHPPHESSPEDLQVVFHVTYSGDVRLSLTAEVFIDYPMPSFIGIPLKLKITGVTFNGVGIVAYIKKRAHVCFLGPEDAEALVGGGDAGIAPLDADEDDDEQHSSTDRNPRLSGKPGALLEDIRIESEMGETDSGKQVLKNVGQHNAVKMFFGPGEIHLAHVAAQDFIHLRPGYRRLFRLDLEKPQQCCKGLDGLMHEWKSAYAEA